MKTNNNMYLRENKRRIGIFIVLIFVIFIAAFLLLCIFHSKFIFSQYDLDVNSGKLRERVYVLGLLISEKILKSPIADYLSEESLTKKPSWRIADISYRELYNPLVVQRISYKYGQIRGDLKSLVLIFSLKNIKEDKRKDICMFIIKLLKDEKLEDISKRVNLLNKIEKTTEFHFGSDCEDTGTEEEVKTDKVSRQTRGTE